MSRAFVLISIDSYVLKTNITYILKTLFYKHFSFLLFHFNNNPIMSYLI